MVLVLRDFIVITELLSFQTCLILKSSLLLLIHSRPFLLLRPSYFIATVSFGIFCPCLRRPVSVFMGTSRYEAKVGCFQIVIFNDVH